LQGVLDGDADIVALQEVTREQASMLERDVALVNRYPHRRIVWSEDWRGMSLFSAYPILEHGTLAYPPLIWARLDLGAGRTVVVVNAHPTLHGASFRRYDPAYRDRAIMHVRALVDPFLDRDEALILVGDFNVTVRETAYGELTARFQDAQLSTRTFPHPTWRGPWTRARLLPFLRLDYILCSARITPLHTRVDLRRRGSDHCAVRATVALRG
jgi:endonuclease/exonuclease/phosphatase family metal-dependent hydrolase